MALAFALARPREVILLGLGGGSLLHALRKACPDANAAVVEMRPQVVAIAREYFQLDSLQDGQLIIADAKQQLRLFPSQSCDLLLADLFYDNRMHPWQEQQKFFLQAQKCLRPGGWLAINFDSPRLVDSDPDDPDAFAADCDALYLTLDIDVLPACEAPGVSAPAARGVRLELLEPLLERLKASGKLRLADLAELNPEHDIDNRTAKVAARLIHLLSL